MKAKHLEDQVIGNKTEKIIGSIESDQCPYCGGLIITDNSSGEFLCSACGFVVTERTQALGSELRAFTLEEYKERARTGIPSSLAVHDMGLATIIGLANRDASGKPLTGSTKTIIERLRTWDSRTHVHQPVDRNFRQAFSELGRLKDKLAIGDALIEKAAYVYRKAMEKKLVRGRSISALIVASLYVACRSSETPRTLKELCYLSNLKKREVSRCYRLLIRELDLRMPVLDPTKCITRIASKIGVGEKTKRKAVEFLERADESRISAGKDPMGMAATALYISCLSNDENITQKDVAEAAGVTEVTVRNRYHGLKLALKL